MKKRVVIFSLILTLLLAILPVSAMAAGTTPGLYYQRLIYGDSDTLHEDGNWQSRPVSVEFGKKFPLALYYYNGATYTPVTEDVAVSGPLELEPTGTGGNHYYVIGKNWGTGELVYEPEDDLQCALRVNVDIPAGAAPYKAPERSQANYLQKFQLDRNLPDEDRVFYIMAEGGFGDPDSVQATFPGSNQVNFRWSVKTLPPNGESYIRIDKISKTGDLVLDIEGADGHSHRVRLKVQDVTPGLYVRNIERNGYEGIEDPNNSMSPDPISMTKGFNRAIALYWFDGKNYIPVTNAEGTGFAGLQRLLSADHHYILSAEEWGSGAIEAEIGGNTQSLELKVALQRTSFFSRQEYSTDALGGGCFFNRGEDEETVVWFMMDEGFSFADAKAIALTSPTAGVNASQVAETSVVLRPGTESNPRYDLKIEVLKGPNDIGLNSYTLRVEGKSGDYKFSTGFGVYEHRHNNGMTQYPLEEGDSHDGQSKVFNVSGVPVVAGIFVREADGDIITMVADAENNWTFRDIDTPEATENWGTFRAIEFGAAVRATTASGSVYNLDETLTRNMQLHSVSLKAVEGEEENGKPRAFSLSGSQWVTESTSLENGFHLYWSSLYSGEALLECKVSMGDEEPFLISAKLRNQLVEEADETRPSGDSVAQLNDFLAEFAEDYADCDPELFRLVLVLNPKAAYEGTIRVPADFPAELWLHGEAGKDRTTLRGSLEAGSVVGKVDGIDFLGAGKDLQGQEPAIFGETVQNIYDCSFTGYPIALEGKESLMTPSRGNVFLNNGVAVLVDMEGSNGANRHHWENNRFLNNDVAVQVLSLCDFISPFNLRIYDSDFIDNGMDFDFRSPRGNYYLYRNYYAHTANGTPEFGSDFRKDFWNDDRDRDGEPDCDRDYRTPTTSNVDGILLVTNPRRLHSILHEDDTLWIDLGRIVEVLNQEASDLIIDGEALTDQDEDVEIKVRNEEEEREGSWHFKGNGGGKVHLASVSLQSSPTGFNAGLDVTRSSSRISVTVQHSSVLEAEIPELSIPCNFTQAYVTRNDVPVAFTLVEGEIRFPVAQGGTYVIHQGSAPAVEESEIVSAGVSGSTFSAEVLCATAQETAIVAAYGVNRQLLDSWVYELKAGANSVTQSLTNIDAETVQIFVLGTGAIPVCESSPVPAG